MTRRPYAFAAWLLAGTYLIAGPVVAQPFTEVTDSAGIEHAHVNALADPEEAILMAGGGAVADHDRDGDPDLYLIGGGGGTNRLLRNNGDGTFTDVTAGSGTDLVNVHGTGPIFADVDGDGDRDLLVLSVHRWAQPPGSDPDLPENRPRLFLNNGSGVYTEAGPASGFTSGMPGYSATLGDLDRDGDLDLFMTHWVSDEDGFQYFWENDGAGVFRDVTNDYLGGQISQLDRFSFTANITDLDRDGWPDVLLASDFGQSQIFMSDGLDGGDLTFTAEQPAVLTDENGMGAAVGDYDNDGDMDWFVTSIWDPDGISEGNWGVSGNRLYRNTGDGTFEDATDEAGVRQGYWGWGACFADFDNDGNLDIFHENGFSIDQAADFHTDPARLFLSNGDGTFTESAMAQGIDHVGQGRGIACFDYDLDGDLDILVMPNDQPVRLYRNDVSDSAAHLGVVLADTGGNPDAVGARIELTTDGGSQIREVTAGNNYISSNPFRQHFGLGAAAIQSLRITWPDGGERVIGHGLAAGHTLMVGRYCHVIHLMRPRGISPVTPAIHVLMPDGTPVAGKTVELAVQSGPNAGWSDTQATDAQGMAAFMLDHAGFGLDELVYRFEIGGDMKSCRALVDWYNGEILLRDGFDDHSMASRSSRARLRSTPQR